MNNFLKILICSILFIIAMSIKVQGQLTMSLDSAISYAIEHNKTLLSSKLDIVKSQQKIKEAIALGLPQISTSVDYTTFLGAEASLQLNPLAPPIIIDFNPTSNFKATATEILFNGGYYVGVQMAKLSKQLSEQNYKSDIEDVNELTCQAYYTVLVSERLLKLVQENVVNAKKIYEKTNNLVSAGTIEEIEAKKLKIMVTTAENALKTTERQVELGYNLLRLQLGIDADSVINRYKNQIYTKT